MPSSFMVKRNYAHCPLKKRPLALYNEPAEVLPEQEEPEDLSVKKPRLSSPPPPEFRRTPEPVVLTLSNTVGRVTAFSPVEPSRNTTQNTLPVYPEIPSRSELRMNAVYDVPPPAPSSGASIQHHSYYYNHNNSHVVSPTPVKAEPVFIRCNNNNNNNFNENVNSSSDVSGKSQENLPSLAEYYLQLFKATSEAEAKSKKNEPQPSSGMSWQPHSYLPPSPQTSPVSHGSIRPDSTITSDMAPQLSPQTRFYSSPAISYPESSALISPVSTCSESEGEENPPSPAPSSPGIPNTPEPQQQQQRYACGACGKTYSTQAGLRKHGELHCGGTASGGGTAPRAFACKHCGKTYTSVGALKMHIRTHTLPCKCHVCGKAFSRPWLLQGHIRTHTGEKPFECQQCHRSFADRSNLRAHQQTHERVKKYACGGCRKTFSRMSLLNKHSQNACAGVSKFPTPPPEGAFHHS